MKDVTSHQAEVFLHGIKNPTQANEAWVGHPL